MRKLFARRGLFPSVLINQAECIVAARITWIVFDDLVCRKFRQVPVACISGNACY